MLNGGFYKSFDFRKRHRFRLEAALTNLLNHPSFAAPDLNISSQYAGVMLARQSMESARARTTRFGMRPDF